MSSMQSKLLKKQTSQRGLLAVRGELSSPLRFSLRTLAVITLTLLISSQTLLFSVWKSGHAKKLSMLKDTAEPIVTHWRVNPENSSNTKIRLRATGTAEAVGFLTPGTAVRAYQYKEFSDNNDKYLFLMTPINGFALKKLFEPIVGEDEFDASPFMYEGYRKEGRNLTARYLYAPTILIVAQQFWNALQVFQVFLSIALYYVWLSTATAPRPWKKCVWGVGGALSLLIMLPFSMYVSSPGAMVFTLVTLMTCKVALSHNPTELVLDIGRKDSIPSSPQEPLVAALIGNDNCAPEATPVCLPLSAANTEPKQNVVFMIPPNKLVVQEEWLGFLCNLASSLYNYHDSNRTWPNWRYHFFNVDKYFGWTGAEQQSSMDMFNNHLYTLGLPNVDVPLYVPGARGSTTGGHLFWLLWSIIPTLYISYYLCMYLLAPRAPGAKIQRALLLFSMFHFLFMTDVVAYKYGRGYWSPHAETFHWCERWAWRVAILMPIYQNCISGHWKNGNLRFPWLGKLVHNFVLAWAVGFVVLQIICSDCFRFYFYLTGGEIKSLMELLNIQTPGIEAFHPFNYHGALVVMWVTYLFVMLSGFTRFHVKVEGTMLTPCRVTRNRKAINSHARNRPSEQEQLIVTISSNENNLKSPKRVPSPQNSVSRLYRRLQHPDSPPISHDPILDVGDETMKSGELGYHIKIERV